MTAKEILFEDSARSRIGAGLDALANAVKVTLGPRGRNVLIAKSWGAPIVTKDGVTVAKEIEIDDRFANLGVQMVKEVASKTSDIAGDGTTTATVLAQAIYREGAKLVAAGANPMDLKRGIEAAVEVVVAHLQRLSTPTSNKAEIAQVAIISANGDVPTGSMIAEAVDRVGKEGVVTIEEAKGMETTLEVVDGMQLDRGYLSAYFVTDAERMEVVLADAYILICEARLASMKQLLPVLEKVASEAKPLLVIADDVEGEALATLVVNRLRGSLQVCAIKAPGYGDRRRATLQDIAALTGATAFTEDIGRDLEKATTEDLGRAKRIIIDKDTTTIVGGAGAKDVIEARVRTIRRELEDATSDHDRDKLAERLAKLAGGVGVIHVGAATELEMKEKTARVDDAMHAVRAAVAEGIVAGGGVALVRCIPALTTLAFTDDRRFGVNIIRRALEEPLRQIAENCGREGSVVCARVREGTGNFGYNGATDAFEDLLVAGVIDPTKVVRVALQNASSVAALMLTTEAAVAQIAAAD